MTELQMGLIGLGAFAVVGVLAYNKWQEVRQRRLTEQAVKSSHQDVLLGGKAEPAATMAKETRDDAPMDRARDATAGERIEPVLILDTEPEEFSGDGLPDETEPAGGAPTEPRDAQEREPAYSPSSREAARDPDEVDGALPDSSPLLSPQVDFIAAIDMVEAVASSEICNAPREALAYVKKPVRWIGYNEQVARWEAISGRDAGEFRHVRAGMQLADRQGPAGDGDLSAFTTAMQDLADQFSGIAELPSRQAAFDAAAKLDEFCASVDIQIGINVVSRGQTFPGTKLRTLAEVAGMAIDADRRFVRRDENGNVLFVLLNQDAAGFAPETMKTMNTHGVTFLLDVPCVAQGGRVFNQMVELARHFAEVLQGELVDDNQHPLTESSMEPIRKQIEHYQALLAERRLPAGGPLARRLFS